VINIFYFHNLAKHTYGLLPLEQHKKELKKLKKRKKINGSNHGFSFHFCQVG
jgi:hypothetical protein